MPGNRASALPLMMSGLFARPLYRPKNRPIAWCPTVHSADRLKPSTSQDSVRHMNRVNFPDQADYEIHVEGHIGEQWSNRFDGLAMDTTFNRSEKPITILSGTIADQAALHGLVNRIRDLGLTLLLIRRIETCQKEDRLRSRDFL
jgi:hypothetical protein